MTSSLKLSIVALLGSVLLTACSQRQQITVPPLNATIQDGLPMLNVDQAGDPSGKPVAWQSISTNTDGRFVVELQDEPDRGCRYEVTGTLKNGQVSADPEITERCANRTRAIAARVIPRNRPHSNEECRQADDNARLACYTLVVASNEQLALLTKK